MDANRSQFFAKKATSATNAYTGAGQSHELQSTMNNLKVAVAGGDLEVSLIGPDAAKVDILVKAGETLDFGGLQFNKIAWRQASATVTLLRVWAWI